MYDQIASTGLATGETLQLRCNGKPILLTFAILSLTIFCKSLQQNGPIQKSITKL